MKQSSIVKTFLGKHIDLSKVVAISDAEFIDRMGFGGWLVGFDIDIQLLDKPLRYERMLQDGESEFNENTEYVLVYGKDGTTPLAVENLQKQINDLVEQWKEIQSSAKT